MNSLEFKDKILDKKEFYSSKHIMFFDAVDLSKIIVSTEWKINDKTSKYYCGYVHDDIIRPLCIIMPQMTGYIKYFDKGAENMPFVSDKYGILLKNFKKL